MGCALQLGLEQGFTVARRPVGGSGALRLSIGLSGDLHAALAGGGGGLVLDGGGRAVLAYRDLVASDARGRVLRSWLQLEGNRLEIRVDTAAAAYPVRIDPLIQLAKLTASDGAANDQFGILGGGVLDGSTVAAGAPAATVGAIRVRGPCTCSSSRRVGGAAQLRPKRELTASDGAAKDQLGDSVGVSSMGRRWRLAPQRRLGTSGRGRRMCSSSRRVGGAAGRRRKVKLAASDGPSCDAFGLSVAVSSDGSTVVAGGPIAAVGLNPAQGAAYVFVEPAGGVGQRNPGGAADPSDGATQDRLGLSVGVSSDGSTVVAGALRRWAATRSRGRRMCSSSRREVGAVARSRRTRRRS